MTLQQENIQYLLKEELLKYAGFFEGVFQVAPHAITPDDFEDYFESIRKLRSIDTRFQVADSVYEYFEKMQ